MSKIISEEVVVCVYPDGKLAGIDHDSGGYPYPLDGLFGVKVWPSVKKALDYASSFKELKVVILKYQYEISN